MRQSHAPLSVAFWVEASDSIGIGHVVRMTAIAQELVEQGGSVHFYGYIPEHLVGLLVGFGHTQLPSKLETLSAFAENLGEVSASYDWLVVDTPFYRPETGGQTGGPWRQVLLVDDMGLAVPDTISAVLNPNYGVEEALYKDASAYLMVGEQYILLRPQILATQPGKRPGSGPVRVLITMGGADPCNLTKVAMDGLIGMDGVRLTVVSGPANGRFEEYVSAYGNLDNVVIYQSVADMGALLADSDVVVIAAGGTLWEALYLGCGVVSYSVNDTQASILTNLERAGELCYLGDGKNSADSTGDALRNAVTRLAGRRFQSKIIDGKGARRVVAYLKRRTNNEAVI